MKHLVVLREPITSTSQLTGDLEEMESEGCYFQEHCQRKDFFDSNIKRWIDEVKSQARAREGTEIQPEDSISTLKQLADNPRCKYHPDLE